MHTTTSLLAATIVLASLAGCLGGTQEQDDDGVSDCRATDVEPEGIRFAPPREDPIVDEHDHWDARAHAVRTCSLEAIARATLTDGQPHKYLGEMDMDAELGIGVVAILVPNEGARGFAVLDIKDRDAPRVLSRVETPTMYPADVKISADGGLVIVGSQSLPVVSTEFADDPFEPASMLGFALYDISDPAAPVPVAHQSHATHGGCHMVRHAVIAGQEFVLCAGGGFFLYPLVRQAGAVAVLAPVAYLRHENGLPWPAAPGHTGDATGLLGSTAHVDGQFYDDGQRTYLLASHWSGGLRVVDVSQPFSPRELWAWQGEGANHYYGAVHTAEVVETAEGRFLLASPELTSEDTVPSLWVFDADDMAAPRLVAEFTAQGAHPSGDLTFTIHQWQLAPRGPDVAVEDVRIYMTYNHAGVWVLRLADILAGDNVGAVLGYHLGRAPLDKDQLPSRAYLGSWDVNVVDGHIYATDRATGLWVFHYLPDVLGDTRLTATQ